MPRLDRGIKMSYLGFLLALKSIKNPVDTISAIPIPPTKNIRPTNPFKKKAKAIIAKQIGKKVRYNNFRLFRMASPFIGSDRMLRLIGFNVKFDFLPALNET